MQNNNSLNTPHNISQLIEYHNELIFDQEIWVGKDLRKVAEVTYSYNAQTNINETLFVKLGELNLDAYSQASFEDRKKLLQAAREKLEEILYHKLDQIIQALEAIKQLDTRSLSEEDIIKKNIFINALNEKKDLLKYASLAIDFEIEKATGVLNLSENAIKMLEHEIHGLDKKIYGGDIKDNPEEAQLAFESFYPDYLKNRDSLTQEEQERMNSYLEKARNYLPEGYTYHSTTPLKKINEFFLKTQIPREKYIEAFNKVAASFQGMQHFARVNPNAASISDGPISVDFPATEKFDSISIERFLKLSNHEFETHCVTDQNNKTLLGNLRGAASTTKDEGVAVLMERILVYGSGLYTQKDGKTIIDKSKLEINSNFFKILMCELLDDEQLQDFLELAYKVSPDIISPEDRFKRLKRNNKKHGQHKDTSYTRGLLQVVDEINDYILSNGEQGIALEDLFLGKISFEETLKLKKLKELKEANGESVNILKPLFIAEALYYILRTWESREKFSQQKYLEHLQEKYPIMNISQEILDSISDETKMQVTKILISIRPRKN